MPSVDLFDDRAYPALFQMGRSKLLAESGTRRCVVPASFDFLFGFLGNKWGGKSFSQRAAFGRARRNL
jgi:hypothetical protein